MGLCDLLRVVVVVRVWVGVGFMLNLSCLMCVAIEGPTLNRLPLNNESTKVQTIIIMSVSSV